MKRFFTQKNIVILVLAIVFSFMITTWNTERNVSPCFGTPLCDVLTTDTLSGDMMHIGRGFPRPYHEVVRFHPTTMGASYETSSSFEIQGFNKISFAIDIVFWYALLDLGHRVFQNIKRTKKS